MITALELAQDALSQCLTHAGIPDTLRQQVDAAYDAVTAAMRPVSEAAGATPKTDELMHLLSGIELTMPSLLDHARTLERDLTAARQRIEGLETQMGAERVACNQRVEEQRLRVHAALDTVMGLKLEMGLYAERQNTLLARAESAESRLAAVEAERDAIRLATIEECAMVCDLNEAGMRNAANNRHATKEFDEEKMLISGAESYKHAAHTIRHLKEKS